ncbi:hypothetical protein P691DRAFT_804741 [Macrolepiota fuliginosa MF-IS2]|uniref:Uncharacterized protein n=1 Tax=Macrolepiota fuliginosa MF-IS2 TaxID=1400762 RepID=A0A9P5XB46_9AGAR|nr:hypothetical protein P691DRAFT_804741 [Macrolepiota fuliginosa MF-IS2]
MPFFENAYDFEVNGGNFYDIGGNQNNRTRDSSLNMSGTGNTLGMNGDYSRQDARTFNAETNASTAYAGPSYGNSSTYAGYGQVPPTATPMVHPPMPPYGQPADPQAQHYQAVYYHYLAYLTAMQQYQQHAQQFSPPAQNASEDQPAQAVQGASQPQQDTQDTPHAPQLTITQDGEQDEMDALNFNFGERLNIQEDRNPVYTPIPQARPQAQLQQCTSTYN